MLASVLRPLARRRRLELFGRLRALRCIRNHTLLLHGATASPRRVFAQLHAVQRLLRTRKTHLCQTPSARRSIHASMLRYSLRRVAAAHGSGTMLQSRTLAHLATRGPGFLGCLGHGDWSNRDALEVVLDDNGNQVKVKSIGAGWAHSGAVLEDGVCVVWGRYLEPPESALRLSHIERVVPPLARLVNATASLLDRDNSLRLRPTPITDQCKSVACGAGVTALIKANGSLEMFGANQFGQCGVGDHSDVVREPAPVKWDSQEKPISKVSLGFRHGLCLSSEGQVLSWGKNDAGQLGDGTRNSRPALAPINLDEECMSIGAGLNHSAALTTDGRLFVWGKMRDSSAKKPSAVSRVTRMPMAFFQKYSSSSHTLASTVRTMRWR